MYKKQNMQSTLSMFVKFCVLIPNLLARSVTLVIPTSCLEKTRRKLYTSNKFVSFEILNSNHPCLIQNAFSKMTISRIFFSSQRLFFDFRRTGWKKLSLITAFFSSQKESF